MAIAPLDALSRLREIGLGFAVSQSFFAACEMGVFDLLEGGPKTLDALASELKVEAEGLRRLLVVLHRLQLVERRGDTFSNSELGSFLTSSSRYHMNGLAKIEKFVRMWEYLPDALKTYGPVWVQAFGVPSQEIFVELYADPVQLRRFCDYMDSYSVAIGEEIAERYDFSKHRCILDVAGGPGGLSRTIGQRHPHLHGIVMDLPPVLEVTRERIAAAGLSDRYRTETADLFEGPYPKGADVATLSWILHDWNDEKALAILRHCHEALPPDGVLLISEMVMNDDFSGSSLWSEVYSLFMLVCCESSGRERTESEHRALLREAGFASAEILRSHGPRDLVVARKVAK